MFRRLPFKQDRNRQAGDIQLAGIINDAFGSRNQLRHTVHFLKMSIHIQPITAPAHTGPGHDRPSITGEGETELHKIQIIFQRITATERNTVYVVDPVATGEVGEAHAEACPVRIKIFVPRRDWDIDRLDMFAPFITLSVPVMPLEDHFTVYRIAFFGQFIHFHFHPFAVVLHYDTFVFQPDDRIGRHRFNICSQQSDGRKACGYDQ